MPETIRVDDRPAEVGRRLRDVARRGYWLPPAVLTLAVCMYHITRTGLWRDELATWSAVDRSPGQLFQLLHHIDAVSGAYYFLLKGWVGLFGHSLLTLRMPSALAMAGSAALVALIGRQVFDRRVGLTAGLLFAVIPSVSRYGQEARSYAFVVLAVAAASWALLRALEQPRAGLRGLGWWGLYACCVGCAGLFHLVSLTILASHAGIVAHRWWRVRARGQVVGFVLAVPVGLLPLLPLAWIGMHQQGRQLGWLAAPTIQYVGDAFWPGLFGSSWTSVTVMALAALPLAWPRGRRRTLDLYLLAMLPVGLVWLVSQSGSHYFLDRYLLFTLPFWVLLAASALAGLRPRAVGLVGLAAVVLLAAPQQLQLRQPYAREHFDAAKAAAVLAAGYRPGDGMALPRGSFHWFFQVDTALGLYLPSQVAPTDVFRAKSPAQQQGLYSAGCPDDQTLSCLAAAAAPRIWVVTVAEPSDPFAGLSEAEKAALTSQYRVRSVTEVPGMVLTLMER
ncbi:glycosyltransferase family 39 protein [Kitasatospora azatica]|uniref:glycosyltransferase family 39 protein n=1 Tax=Kitasatospora azatica TaxID=58347 RepID=UPI0018DD6036|nr:glycosyltransferase family 39 protein [Kitasatospora azatica]